MADIHDYLDAVRVTDDALRELGDVVNNTPHRPDVVATAQAGRAIALAIRELGTRLDFVLRDIDRKG